MNELNGHPKYDLIQKICNKSVHLTSLEMAIEAMKDLALLGFYGLMCPEKGYFAWGCGSWLGQSIKEFVKQCEEKSNRCFRDIIFEMWDIRNLEEHVQLIRSYLLLPIPSFKTENMLASEWDKPGFGQVWRELNQEWKQKAFQSSSRNKKDAD